MNIHGVELNVEYDMVVRSYKEENGTFEDAAIEFWKKSLKTGETSIDVGAYTGLYSILAAKYSCMSIAYEPNPIVRERLLENIATNQVNVIVRESALSDSEGELYFYIKPDTKLTSAGTLIETDNYTKIRVLVETLHHPSKVCAIKIDVEGNELAVLQGAKELLERDHPRVIVECLTEVEKKSVLNYMSSLGYSFTVLDDRNLGFFLNK